MISHAAQSPIQWQKSSHWLMMPQQEIDKSMNTQLLLGYNLVSRNGEGHKVEQWARQLARSQSNVVKFSPLIRSWFPLIVECAGKVFSKVVNFKILGLNMKKHLNWRCHTDQLLSRLNASCYVIWKSLYVLNRHVLQTVYSACVQSLVEYGVIFWGLIVGVSTRHSFRQIFRNVYILTLPCLCIYSLIIFVSIMFIAI
jgi:hypothetical protein